MCLVFSSILHRWLHILPFTNSYVPLCLHHCRCHFASRSHDHLHLRVQAVCQEEPITVRNYSLGTSCSGLSATTFSTTVSADETCHDLKTLFLPSTYPSSLIPCVLWQFRSAWVLNVESSCALHSSTWQFESLWSVTKWRSAKQNI